MGEQISPARETHLNMLRGRKPSGATYPCKNRRGRRRPEELWTGDWNFVQRGQLELGLWLALESALRLGFGTRLQSWNILLTKIQLKFFQSLYFVLKHAENPLPVIFPNGALRFALQHGVSPNSDFSKRIPPGILSGGEEALRYVLQKIEFLPHDKIFLRGALCCILRGGYPGRLLRGVLGERFFSRNHFLLLHFYVITIALRL